MDQGAWEQFDENTHILDASSGKSLHRGTPWLQEQGCLVFVAWFPEQL